MNIFARFGDWISHLFKDPRVEKAFVVIGQIAQEAEPLVAAIAAIVPNKTFQQVVDAYHEYGIPFSQQLTNDPTAIGNYLQTLAVSVLQKNHQDKAVNILNTAVNIAVSVLKATRSTVPPVV